VELESQFHHLTSLCRSASLWQSCFFPLDLRALCGLHVVASVCVFYCGELDFLNGPQEMLPPAVPPPLWDAQREYRADTVEL
jgi:hypothetical protein